MESFSRADFHRNLAQSRDIIAAMRAQILEHHQLISGTRAMIAETRKMLRTRLCGDYWAGLPD